MKYQVLRQSLSEVNSVAEEALNIGILKSYKEAEINVPYEEYYKTVHQESVIEFNKLISYTLEEINQLKADGSLAKRIAHICDKVNNLLRPSMQTKDATPVSDDVFEMIMEKSKEFVISQLIFMGFLFDQFMNNKKAEEKVEENQLTLLTIPDDFKEKVLRNRTGEVENLSEELSLKLLAISYKAEIFSLELLHRLQKANIEKREEMKQEEFDLKKHDIKQLEIERGRLKEEVKEKDIQKADTQKKLFKEIVVEIDTVFQPIFYQHILVAQKPGAAAA